MHKAQLKSCSHPNIGSADSYSFTKCWNYWVSSIGCETVQEEYRISETIFKSPVYDDMYDLVKIKWWIIWLREEIELITAVYWRMQPLHTGFVSDAGGNNITVHWYNRRSNLHHVCPMTCPTKTHVSIGLSNFIILICWWRLCSMFISLHTVTPVRFLWSSSRMYCIIYQSEILSDI